MVMKNVNFSNKLVLRNNPITEIVISGFITIVITATSLAITYFGLPKNSVFSCNRIATNQSNCNFKQTTLWLGLQQVNLINQLTGVVVAPFSGEDGRDLYYVVILKTADSGNFNLINYESEDQAKSVASQINVFIANQRQNNLQITLTSELKIWQLLFGLFLLTIALAVLAGIIVIPFYRKITLDKTTNQIIIRQIGLLKNQITTYKISDVTELIKEEKINKSNRSNIKYIMLVTGNNRIHLSLYYGKKYENELAMTETLANFLNLPITHQQIKN
jgi:hypothetical protein